MKLEPMENTPVVMFATTIPIITHYKLPITCFFSIFYLFKLEDTPCMDS